MPSHDDVQAIDHKDDDKEIVKILSRDQIISCADYDKEAVKMPEWGGQVYVRTMTSKQMEEMQVIFLAISEAAEARKQNPEEPLNLDNLHGLKSRLVRYTLCDEDGALLFGNDEDVEILQGKNPAAIDRLFDAAMVINKLSEAAQDEVKKNSNGALFIDSNGVSA